MSNVRQLRNAQAERWDFLSGLLPNKIDPTDIDLAYERHGNFLFLEGKRPGGIASMKFGQRLFLRRLHRPPEFCVVLFEGTPPDQVERFCVLGQSMQETGVDGLCAFIRRWYAWADTTKEAA